MSEVGGQQIGYGDAMDAFPSWVSLEDLDPDLRVNKWRVVRGRVDETQRTGTGTAHIFVHDRAGVLGAGSEFPIHARLLLRGEPRFRGFVDDVDVEVDNSGVVSRVSIECVDLLDYLAGFELLAGIHGTLPTPEGQEQFVYYPVDQVDDRQFSILDDALVPASLRSVFSGNIMANPVAAQSGTPALQLLDDLADAEWPGVSNRFVDSIGRYCFRGRHARFNPGDPTYGVQFWEAGTGTHVTAGRAQIRALAYGKSRKLITNSALAYPEGMAESDFPLIVIEDQLSIGKYGRRSWSAENLLTRRHLSNGNTGADEAVLFSTGQVANYKAPRDRIRKTRFRSLLDSDPRAAATWELMKKVEIGDVIDIYTDWISGRYFVEGFTLEVQELDGTIPDATLDLDLSPQEFWSVDPF